MQTKWIQQIIACTLAGGAMPVLTVVAQPGPPPHAAHAPPPSLRPAPVETVQGTVSQYLLNPRGDVEGLLLSDGMQIHFPPHMGAELTEAVKPRDSITAQGEKENDLRLRALSITDTTSGKSVEAARSQQPGGNLRVLHAQGKVQAVLVAPRGEPEGIVLDNGTIIRVPPHARQQFADLLKVGQSVAAAGHGTENQFGRCIQATELGARGQALQPVQDPGSKPKPPQP